eukprot:gb/GFBE01025802.1/.p1 GENE.gb/GFBE01025802.1/~~gb/GFBE01025802.1/.p1  ORF type:complete len:427 (+),score=79.54 gb/GFBE01025802.1/:1-1281(+)
MPPRKRPAASSVRNLAVQKKPAAKAKSPQKKPSADCRSALPGPNLLGPPYRWLLPDCRCFYTENLYVKTSLGEFIDRYFRLPSLETEEEDFWNEFNIDAPPYKDAVKRDIFQQVVKESTRRMQLSAQYRYNSEQCFKLYKPLHKELFPSHELPMPAISEDEPPDVAPGLPAQDIFTPEFLAAWKDAVKGSKAPAGLKHVHNECFQVAIFHKQFCAKIVAEIEHFKKQHLPHQFPNNMNRGGCILNEIGLGPFMDRLIHLYLGPLCKAVYGRFLDEGFEAHHSFIVSYSMGGDRGLGVHDDNSEVTINIALRDDFEGASLALYQHARTAHPQLEAQGKFLWKVGAGTMLFHPGEMLHEVLPLEKGDRMGLIVWLRSNNYRSKNGCPLCSKTTDLMYAPQDGGGEFRRLVSVGLPFDPVKRGSHWPAA